MRGDKKGKPVLEIFTAVWRKQQEPRASAFHLLSLSGILICLVFAVSCWMRGDSLQQASPNLLAALVIIVLMVLGEKSGRYQLCYLLETLCLFFGLYTVMFFLEGGYKGGIPMFFCLAVIFTVYVLEGMPAVLLAAIEIIYYCGLCIFAYYYPEKFTNTPGEKELLLDVVINICLVSIFAGIIILSQIYVYNGQQRMLEHARAEAEKASQAKSRFLAGMSHEIRTPIHAMLGMNEMILRESDSELISEYGRTIENEGRTLLELIDNVLDASQTESGKMKLLEEEYEFQDLVRELDLMGTGLIKGKDVVFQLKVDDKIPPVLVGDCPRLRQVIYNLISNAAKYTPFGEILLDIKKLDTKQQNGQIELFISVQDTGIGIRKEDLGDLFDMFIRVDLHREVEGSGLGLSIAKNLTHLMGGTINVESIYGEGSKFYVRIPQKVSNNKVRQEERQLETGRLRLRAPGSRVLVVDDNQANQTVIKALLDRTGVEVEAVSDGRKCLKALSEKTYDLVFMDYMMPYPDGIETLRLIKEADKSFSTPVVALTAAVSAGSGERFRKEGFADCLGKPVRGIRLEETLRALLPEEKMTLTPGEQPGERLSRESKAQLEDLLKVHHIFLEHGLVFFEEEICQYAGIARQVCSFYGEYLRQMEKYWADKDWHNLTTMVHAVKSNAKLLGAEELSEAARQVERCGRRQDVSCMEYALPLFRIVWGRTMDGLVEFLEKYERCLPEKFDKAEETDGKLSKGEILNCIKELRWELGAYQRKEASVHIERLKGQAMPLHLLAMLEEIEHMLASVEYETALVHLDVWEKEWKSREGVRG